MITDRIWNVTISELLDIFRRSLLALIPFMDEAKLPWKEGEAYDEWDEIVASMFNGIVISACQWGIAKNGGQQIELPRYDYFYPDYSNLSFIKLKRQETDDLNFIFHSFVSTGSPFDTVKFIKANNRGLKFSEEYFLTPIENVQFIFQYRISKNELTSIDRLSIQIDSR